jgi:hypothetical protein
MAEHVDAAVERVEIDPVRRSPSYVDGLDQRHRFRINTDRLLVKPGPDFESTPAPFPPTRAI